MVRRMSSQDSSSMRSSARRSNSRGKNNGALGDFLKHENNERHHREHVKSYVRREPDEDSSDDNSIDLFDGSSKKKEKPRYSDRFHDSCDSLEESVASFMSRSMLREESASARQSRRNRLEQMRMDRDLVAKLEEANKALEEEQNKKAFINNNNKSLNTFFSSSKRKEKAPDPSGPPSPMSKSTTSASKKILKKIVLPINKPRRSSLPVLSAEKFLGQMLDDEDKEEEVDEQIPAVPALRRNNTNDDFDLGRERNRANVGRQRRLKPSRTISGAGSARRRALRPTEPTIREIGLQ